MGGSLQGHSESTHAARSGASTPAVFWILLQRPFSIVLTCGLNLRMCGHCGCPQLSLGPRQFAGLSPNYPFALMTRFVGGLMNGATPCIHLGLPRHNATRLIRTGLHMLKDAVMKSSKRVEPSSSAFPVHQCSPWLGAVTKHRFFCLVICDAKCWCLSRLLLFSWVWPHRVLAIHQNSGRPMTYDIMPSDLSRCMGW